MYYIDSATNSASMQCKAAWDAGYIADIYNNCIMWDSSKYSQWSDANWASWVVIDNVPYWKSWNDGYQTDLLNKEHLCSHWERHLKKCKILVKILTWVRSLLSPMIFRQPKRPLNCYIRTNLEERIRICWYQ